MARDRDVAAFGERAPGYDGGWRGRMHHQIAAGAADLALSCVPAPRRILDVGSGTGYPLGRLAARAPQAEVLAGIDAAPAMIEAARAAAADPRLRFTAGTAERLPWPAATFDLVVSTTSFDHWTDQRAGHQQPADHLAAGLPGLPPGKHPATRPSRSASNADRASSATVAAATAAS
jgi:SAM-dependent methyltransferase